jgi:cyclophilin family peptidyl-prolyl cis-trans isomerase
MIPARTLTAFIARTATASSFLAATLFRRGFRRGLRLGLGLGVVLAAGSTALAADAPTVRLETSMGNIDIELFPDRAPKTVENFLSLVDDGFYDGLVFHRVVAGFVIQAGGYDHRLTYRSPPGTVVNESANRVKNARYTVAMARLNDPDSADTQFFINVKDNTHLDWQPGQPGYTVFGRVVAGTEVVTAIELVDTGIEAGMAGVPLEDVIIQRAVRL